MPVFAGAGGAAGAGAGAGAVSGEWQGGGVRTIHVPQVSTFLKEHWWNLHRRQHFVVLSNKQSIVNESMLNQVMCSNECGGGTAPQRDYQFTTKVPL